MCLTIQPYLQIKQNWNYERLGCTMTFTMNEGKNIGLGYLAIVILTWPKYPIWFSKFKTKTMLISPFHAYSNIDFHILKIIVGN